MSLPKELIDNVETELAGGVLSKKGFRSPTEFVTYATRRLLDAEQKGVA